MKKLSILIILCIISACTTDDILINEENQTKIRKEKEELRLDTPIDNVIEGGYTNRNCLTDENEIDPILNASPVVVNEGIFTSYSFTYHKFNPYSDNNFVNSCENYTLRLEIARGDINPNTGEPEDPNERCFVLMDSEDPYPLVYNNLSYYGSNSQTTTFTTYSTYAWNCFYYRFVLEAEECGYIIYEENPFDPDNPIIHDFTYSCDAFTEWRYYKN